MPALLPDYHHHPVVFTFLLGFLAFSLLLPLPVARADCYWPNGSENYGHDPCYSPQDGAEGLCCRSGDACLGNSVCMSGNDGNTTYYRGSCGYPDWAGIASCPNFCIFDSGADPSGETPMFKCPGTDNLWYCGDANQRFANCSSGRYILTLSGDSSPYTTVGVLPSSTLRSADFLPSSPSLSTSPVAVAMDPLSTMPGGPDPATSPAAVPLTPSLLPTATANDSASPPTPAGNQSSAIVPLAVGVSIGAASILAAGVIALLLWRKCRRDAPARAETPPPEEDDNRRLQGLGVEEEDPCNMMYSGPYHNDPYTTSATPMHDFRPGWDHGGRVPAYNYPQVTYHGSAGDMKPYPELVG